MAKKVMLIDAAHPEETRVVVLNGKKLEEYDFETANKKQIKGNIYLAKIVRVEPSLQAAFVDYGGNRHGFLAFNEIHPDYYRIPVADREAIKAARQAELAADADFVSEFGDLEDKDTGVVMSPEPPLLAGEAEEHYEDFPPSAEEAPLLEIGGIAPWTEEDPGTIGQDPALALRHRPQQLIDDADYPSEPALQDAERSAPEISDHDTPYSAEVDTSSDIHSTGSSYHHRHAGGSGYESPSWEDRLPSRTEEEIAPPADRSGDGLPTPLEQDLTTETLADAVDAEPELPAARQPYPRGRPRGRGRRFRNNGDGEDSETGEEFARRPRIRQYKIQEVIKRRQVILVQVTKEERGNKGAALTTYLSMPGRYCVLMPNTDRGGGISRKITSLEDRKRLKKIISGLEIPKGMATIVRTAGKERSEAEIRRDFEYLIRQWSEIRDETLKSVAPALIYEEASLIKRAIRDIYSKDIEEVLVDGSDAYKSAKGFMRMLTPSHAKRVQAYKNPASPLFQYYQVEGQLDAIHHPVVQLKSGGYVVINSTEALVAIDVNSGRSTRERNIEETALRTNLEAAEEIARQLRLRDLAGLIVIDFIDMEESRNNAAVERRLREAMRSDRARIQLGRISAFGLLELSRQRLRPSLFESSMETCHHCRGTGYVRSVESTALHVLRGIEEEGQHKKSDAITVTVPPNVAFYILNQKRGALSDIEMRHTMRVFIMGDESLIPPDFHIEIDKAALPFELPASAPLNGDGNKTPVLLEESADEFIPDDHGHVVSERASPKEKGTEHYSMPTPKESGPDQQAIPETEGYNGEAGNDDRRQDRKRKRRRGRRGGRRRSQTRQGYENGGETPIEPSAPISTTARDQDESAEETGRLAASRRQLLVDDNPAPSSPSEEPIEPEETRIDRPRSSRSRAFSRRPKSDKNRTEEMAPGETYPEIAINSAPSEDDKKTKRRPARTRRKPSARQVEIDDQGDSNNPAGLSDAPASVSEARSESSAVAPSDSTTRPGREEDIDTSERASRPLSHRHGHSLREENSRSLVTADMPGAPEKEGAKSTRRGWWRRLVE